MDPITPSSSSMRLGLESPIQSNALITDPISFMKDAVNVMDEFNELIADSPLQLDNHRHVDEILDTPHCSQELQVSFA